MLQLSTVAMYVLWVCVSLLGVFHTCRGVNHLRRENSPGNIIIGGLFSIHLKTNRSNGPGPLICHDFDIQSFLHSQVMIYAIEEINQRRLLPNFTIGYDIYDTCADVSLAIRATLQLLKAESDPLMCGLTEDAQPLPGDPETKVVIGEQSSEVSIAVARIISLSSVAQISYAATSELLSRKYKFPTFVRTVSSDKHQTQGIVELANKFNWKAVAIVGSDDEYGRYGSERLSDYFSVNDICVEFMEILPSYFNQNISESRKLLVKLVGLINDSSAEAIVLFTKDTNVEIIMLEAIEHKLNRTWIASDTWSTSTKISTLPGIELAGQVFGFTFNGREVPGFRQYLMSQVDRTHGAMTAESPFCLDESSKNTVEDCVLPNSQHQSKQCLDPECLIKYIDKDYSYSIYLAVGVIADSLRRLMKCNSQWCERTSDFTALELLEEIKKVNCTVNTTHIFFDENGDPSLGYAIVYWNRSDTEIKIIGEYWPNGTIRVPDHLEEAMTADEVTAYNCYKTCKPGLELRMPDKRNKCCGYCAPCADGDFSPGNGTACQHCGEKQFSMDGQRDKCFNITEEYLNWSNPFSITLSCLAALGIIITISFAVHFAIYQGTPIVKAVGGYLVFLELLSLLACFCLTFNFQDKPTRDSCRIGLPLFGVAFSLCISCILANLLQILVCFDFNTKVASWIKRIDRVVVVTVVSGIQLTLSVAWMLLDPPVPEETEIHPHNVHTCTLQSVGFFAAMIAYLAFWAFVCFVFAFKGKKLPDLYKNAVLISVSMLLFLIIWIIFVPLFLALKGRNKAAVEIAAILISSYSVLGFHLAPKFYIMIFRKELNNENAITGYIKKHYEQQGRAVIAS
ncbi:G-protein coupled receptor family C group 6 member A-like [Salarias fasciatus]|uniref:G-protein coupled receptor family C group 6 member A-like n=1 Tax=Salarias fasciatus TaxID=181472 RepID=UPI001176B02F|nr:G-protein coupled receptor family C group 6 member A-like [Salarias fasciatus]